MGGERHPVRGQEIHGVHQYDPDEHRQGRRRHEFVPVAVVEYAFGLLVDEFEQELDEGLALAGHTCRGALDDPPDEAQSDHAEQDGRHERIDVQGPEAAFSHRLGEEGEMVLDVGGRFEFFAGGHE